MTTSTNGRPLRVGYVLKRYPRYSETFIVTEILAHEAAGLDVQIFALYPATDTHFQDCISRVRAPVRYLTVDSLKAAEFWKNTQAAVATMPGGWASLDEARGCDAREVCQAMLLARAVRDFNIDHLHAHFATSAASVARMAASFARVPFTITAHAKDIFHESVEPGALRQKLRAAAATVTVSDYNLNYLKETYGDDAANVRRIYNGMDLSQLPFQTPARRKQQIISVGRLVEKKGFGDLILACDVLARRGQSFECKIVGTGEQEAELRQLIDRLDLSQHVQLIGPRPQREVFAMIQEAAVFAAPCIIGEDGNRDGLPTVLLEAMSLGTPCVSTDVTGIPEVIHHGDTGLIVSQRNPGELAGALSLMLQDGDERVMLATAARRLIESEFDVAQNSAKLRDVFYGIAGASLGCPSRSVTEQEQSAGVA